MHYIEVITTSNKKNILEKIALSLVKKKLAACVQILGQINSTYAWKGKIEVTEEYICIIKTKKSAYKKVEKEIMRLHNYSLPQITATDITQGLGSYLEWIGKEVK